MAHSQQHVRSQSVRQVLPVASIDLDYARHQQRQRHGLGEVGVGARCQVHGVVAEILFAGAGLLVAVESGGCEARADGGEGEDGVEEAETCDECAGDSYGPRLLVDVLAC